MCRMLGLPLGSLTYVIFNYPVRAGTTAAIIYQAFSYIDFFSNFQWFQSILTLIEEHFQSYPSFMLQLQKLI